MKNFCNQCVRRQDRLLDEARADELLEREEYGVLSMVTPEGTGYGIPLNYVWDHDKSVYIHCAPEGKKLACLSHNPFVTFAIVGHTAVVANKFTTNYESVVLTCQARTRLPAEERMKALELFLGKYAPDDQTIGMQYARKSFHRTEIIRLDILEGSGKCKVVR